MSKKRAALTAGVATDTYQVRGACLHSPFVLNVRTDMEEPARPSNCTLRLQCWMLRLLVHELTSFLNKLLVDMNC